MHNVSEFNAFLAINSITHFSSVLCFNKNSIKKKYSWLKTEQFCKKEMKLENKEGEG